MYAVQHECSCREDFRERRMLDVHAHVELLQVADPGANVGNFIDRYGFAQSGSPRKHRHQQQKESSENTRNELHNYLYDAMPSIVS